MQNSEGKKNSIIKDFKNLLIWISIALIIRWQVIEPRWIPSGSMLPTLQIQDKILVEKVTPKITSKSNLSKLKNKIVVFKVPEPGSYPYICTYPGHFMSMRGILISEK